MNKILKVIIISVVGLIMLGSFADVSFGQTTPPLSISFQSNPLFSEANFLPGNEVVRTVGVTNNSSVQQNIIVEAINAVDDGGLGDKLHLIIRAGETVLYNNTLGAFLRAGRVPLSTISSLGNTTYSFGVTFDGDANNDTQNAVLGFDLCIGFRDGDKHCGSTTVGGERDTGGETGGDSGGVIIGGTGGGGGGGSGGNGPISGTNLIIFNEKSSGITGATDTSTTGTALITWNTNKLSTSQVVYGPNTTTYTFDVNNLPAFGYPFVTVEDSNKVTSHSVLLTGLVPGQTYVYRVVSRASPPTVSFEHQFTIPFSTEGGDNVFAVNTNTSNTINTGTSVGGVENTGGNNDLSGDGGVVLEKTEPIDKPFEFTNGNVAVAFMSGFGDILSPCSLIALIILLVLYLIWKLWLSGRYEKNGVPMEEIKTKFYIFYSLTTAIVTLLLLVFGQYCPIPIILIAFILSFFAYLYRLFFKVL